MAGWIADIEQQVAGFLVARLVASDVEILNIAVDPERRCSQIGTALLRELLAWPPAAEAENIFLEVRESNRPAIRFYEERGFQQAGRRTNYYRDPVEDALLLQRVRTH